MNEFLSNAPYSKARTVFIAMGGPLFQVTYIQQFCTIQHLYVSTEE
jgi:hypothetical protein